MFTTDEFADECSRSIPVAPKTCAPRLDHTHDSLCSAVRFKNMLASFKRNAAGSLIFATASEGSGPLDARDAWVAITVSVIELEAALKILGVSCHDSGSPRHALNGDHRRSW
jgi:hypothetical protein